MPVLRLVSTISCVLGPIVVGSVLSACSSTASSTGAGGSPESGVNANMPASAGTSSAAGSAGSSTASGGTGGGASEAMNGDLGLSQGGGPASGAGAAGNAPPVASNTDAGRAPDAPPAAADAGAATGMSFFVTSRGAGNGGNFGGLAGADQFCTTLATAVSPALGAKTWHAYLSTTTVNARDRIGTGPWVNAAGVVIGTSVAQIHDEAPGGASEATWPLNNPATALDERGNQVPSQPGANLLHDILTGSNVDGTVSTIGTCQDWTQSTGMTMNGHSNRAGQANSGGVANSWSSSHMTGCGEPTNGMNFQAGTVSLGGGRGSIYCFAID